MEKEDKKDTIFTVRQRRIIQLSTLIVCGLLVVAGFIVPPTGVVDGSVLTAVGELGGFTALLTGLETNWGKK